MFDGQAATVRVWLYARGRDAFAHEWTSMLGGDCSFEDGAWIRIDRATLEPMPAQHSFAI